MPRQSTRVGGDLLHQGESVRDSPRARESGLRTRAAMEPAPQARTLDPRGLDEAVRCARARDGLEAERRKRNSRRSAAPGMRDEQGNTRETDSSAG